MFNSWTRFLVAGVSWLLGILAAAQVDSPHLFAAEARRPNVIFLLADDLGYGDVGCFGQTKIRTPHIDRLAAEGMRLTAHYSGCAVCAPSRCVLMTGLHTGHAFIRDNRQYRMGEEGQYPVPADTVMLPKLLKRLGYATGAFGKWGLGAPETEGQPLRQGIDRFFGYNCQGVAHNYYPTHLWDNDQRIALLNPDFPAHQKFPAGADAEDAQSYARYAGQQYAPDLITEQALAFIRNHKRERFFLYYPTTLAHLALQVPEDSLAEYRGKFPDEPYLGGTGYLPHLTPRACYAAMLTRLDREIGRMIDLVAELGLEEQTIFVFTSDNGPLGERYGGTDTDFFQSAGELRGRKGSLYEGGVRVPCIVRWQGHVAPGSQSARLTGFEDWMPTLLELVGAADQTPREIDGVSFAPTLFGQPQPERPFLYREFPGYGGQQSVRVGNWKAVRQRLQPRGQQPFEPGGIELYDLANDPGEVQDVAAENPDVAQRLAAILTREHVPSELFPIKALDEVP